MYRLLSKNPDTDFPIRNLYAFMYFNNYDADLTINTRRMQQSLGPAIARINAKLVGQRIEPGQLKRTYRLNTNYVG